MAKGNVLYCVAVYEDDCSVRSKVVFTSSKYNKAEQYLHKYLKENPQVSRAYIESKYNANFDKRSFREDEDL